MPLRLSLTACTVSGRCSGPRENTWVATAADEGMIQRWKAGIRPHRETGTGPASPSNERRFDHFRRLGGRRERLSPLFPVSDLAQRLALLDAAPNSSDRIAKG
jgi:hypothetical protein